MTGKLEGYLLVIGQQPKEIFYRLVKQLAEQEGITEQLKSGNQIEWVRRMNALRHLAEEIVYNKVIYTL